MKKNFVFLALIIFFLLFGAVVLAESEKPRVSLYEGKNYMYINQTFYVSDLFLINSDITYVSYMNTSLNKSVGYVNVFGGIGKNFLINPDQIYEIGASKNTSLILPEI